MPRITLWGFLQYDKTLFDGLDLPTGCDPEVLKDTIIMESGDLFPYYQHPGYLKANIRTWFRRMLPQFQKSFDALALEYVANENYDRYEDYSDTFNKESSDKRESGETTSQSDSRSGASERATESTTGSEGSQEDKTSAYDENDYQPSAYTERSNLEEGTTSEAGSTSEEGTSEGSRSGSEEGSAKEDSTNHHIGHLHGNIGVTTNATMIREELELRRYDIYLEIARQFEERFIVQVY